MNTHENKNLLNSTTINDNDVRNIKSNKLKQIHHQNTKRYKSPKLKTAYDIYRDAAITIGPYTGIPSIAARHTAIEYGSIQLDVGHTPREVGMNKLLVLITHFHADHGSDICNCIGHGNKVTVFVPAYCALNLFIKIKCDMSMQKGRPYADNEIIKMVRIIGCKRDNGEFKDQDLIMSSTFPNLVIAELIKMGDKIPIQLHGRDQVAIEPFACYHTVDTCGYVIYDLRKKLAGVISMNNASFVEVNFTEDQINREKRKKNIISIDKSSNTTIDKSSDTTVDVSVITEIYDWKKDSRFADIIKFSEKYNVNMYPEIVDEIITLNFTLKKRRLHFPDGMILNTKNNNDECILQSDDFDFLKKYKININTEYFIPKTMFFGDTGSYIFDPKSIGFPRICELLESVETVIIESTFLESREAMGENKYKERLEKRHMFLFELYDNFKKYPKTEFLLIHFSACYDRATIKKYIEDANKIYGNVKAFI